MNVRGRHYFGIFVLACATLAYQILITRFFSVVLYYHFAFAAVSLAMFGLTRGAMQVYRNPERYAPDRVDVEFARHASLFSLGAVGVMVAFLCAPLLVPEEYLLAVLSLGMLAFILPFTDSGVCITLLLTRLSYKGGKVYAADLSGASLGCLGIIFALFVIDPVSAALWIAALAAAAGWVTARGSDDRRSLHLSAIVTLTLLVAAVVHTGLYASDRRHLGVMWAKGSRQSGTEFERWNTFSRVRVVPLGESTPFGWGLARTPSTKIDQKYLDIDADASTVITRWDDDIRNLSYLQSDVVNAAYLVQPLDAVAVVGVGGGRDILSALFFGAKHITGIEINPAIFEALEEKFADYSGNLHRRPGVSLINAEARSYINHSSERYDLIQISLIDTWAATAAGGLTLTENRLYTVDAWEDFYRKLKPGGLLSISRWYNPTDHRSEFYRLVAIGVSALTGRGVPAASLQRHVVAVNVDKIVTVITRPDPLSDTQWHAARKRLQDQGFTILLGPDVAFDDVTSTILSGEANAKYFRTLKENIIPSTDNRPFFFYTSRLGDLLTHGRSALPRINGALITTLLLVAVTFAACVFYVLVPFIRLATRMSVSSVARPVAYFTAIGMGFMLIEISQMQQLMVFLGHPVYGLGVVLFTLLLFSGLGSTTVRESAPARREMLWRIVGLLTALVMAGLLTPLATDWARSATTAIRVMISVLLLAPPSFFMGMMFPLGLSIWRGDRELLPFFWSANGITSVFASVLGVLLSMELGIAETYAIGACFYAVCAMMVVGDFRVGAEGVVETQLLVDRAVSPRAQMRT
jgi:spermidine synthase